MPPREVAVITVAVGHSLSSSIPAIWSAFRGHRPKLGLASYRAAGLLATVVMAYIVLEIGGRFDYLVPKLSEIVFAFWIAAITLSMGHWARSLMARREDESELLERARREVDRSLLAPLMKSENASPNLLCAIAYAENVNRPPWVRTLERLLLRRGGTYGLMQMKSPRPITDAESVSLFLERLPEYPTLSESPSWEETRSFALYHNDDTQFADLVQSFYSLLEQYSSGEQNSYPDGPHARRHGWLAGFMVLGGVTLIARWILASRRSDN